MNKIKLFSVMLIPLIGLNNLYGMDEIFEKNDKEYSKKLIHSLNHNEADVMSLIWLEEYEKIWNTVKELHKELKEIQEIDEIISPMIEEANIRLQFYKKQYFSHTNKPFNIFLKKDRFIFG